MTNFESDNQQTAFKLLEDSKLPDYDSLFPTEELQLDQKNDIPIPLNAFSNDHEMGPFKNPESETIYKTIIATEDHFYSFSTDIPEASPSTLSFCDPTTLPGRLESCSESIDNLNKILQKTKKNKTKPFEEGQLVVKSYLRDPNLPKRPVTPYLRFAIKERKTIREDFPDVTFKESARMAASRWKKMNKEDKDEYKLEYEKEKTKYEELVKDYKSSKERKNFVMLKGAIKGEQYNVVERVVNKKKKWKAKSSKVSLEYDVGMDNDIDFWTVYHEISSFTDRNVLEDMVRVYNRYKGDMTEEQKELYNKEIGNIQKLGDYLKSFLNFVKRKVLNKNREQK